MEPLLVHPAQPGNEIIQVLEDNGYPWKGVESAEAAERDEPDDGWAGAIVSVLDDADAAFELCRFLRLREHEVPIQPLIMIVRPETLDELEVREDLFDEFVVSSQVGLELAARLRHRFWRTGRGTHPDLIEHEGLVLNLETYQAAIGGEPLNLTFMEYELLKFLATHPGKVFTRETLLSRVWGYDYYGGARTVDVHVRRLRAKLGEEHASLITTVRSVGYRFGSARPIF